MNKIMKKKKNMKKKKILMSIIKIIVNYNAILIEKVYK